MNLPLMMAQFHTTMANKTAPGEVVAMYHLADPKTRETYMSLGVPVERHDWARDIADRCNYFAAMRDALKMCEAFMASKPESQAAMAVGVQDTVKAVLAAVDAL